MSKPSKQARQARKEKLLEPSNQTLYRFFNAQHELLYVGITNNPFNRFSGHASDKNWFNELAYATFTHYPNRLEVDNAETRAIVTEKPKYNKAKNPDFESSADHYRKIKGSLLNSKTILAGHLDLVKLAKQVYDANEFKGALSAAIFYAIHATKIDCDLCQQLGKNKQYQNLARQLNK